MGGITSRFALQRLVAYITCIGALAIAGVNYAALRHLYRLSPVHALLNPTVLWIVGFAVIFLFTAFSDTGYARACQVFIFSAGGIVAALQPMTVNLTSAVFVVFAMVLLNEYTTQRRAAIVAAIVGVTYLISLAIGVDTRTASVVLTMLNMMILVSAVITLFGLISYRQHQIRKDHESMLEQLVAERTHELEEALVQRDTMLQEIHHRVGNSLQLLSSFISLQQDDVEDEQRRVLKETELRVHAIADVHATLYSQHQLSHLPLALYTADLVSDMQIAYRSEADITASIDTGMEAHIDFSISFGVILNELITNAAKHGGGRTQRSEVEVSLGDVDGALRLVVRDHGRGFDAGSGIGIGTELVEQLVGQHGGEIERSNNGGAVVIVSFPRDAVVRDTPVRVGKTDAHEVNPVAARTASPPI